MRRFLFSQEDGASTIRAFVLLAMCSGFLISFEYAITRPASSAMFLSVFHYDAIPWVWLLSVPCNLGVIYLYNTLLPRYGPLRVILLVASVSIVINFLTALFFSSVPQVIFLQFMWKDIYILLMFKQLWSMIHSTISSEKAKYLYGIIFFAGTIGSVLGSFVPSYFAVDIGSSYLLYFTLPVYLLFFLIYRKAFSYSVLKSGEFIKHLTVNPHPKEAFSLIRQSKFLIGTMLLVVLMQVSVGLMDYQFNVHLEQNIPDIDLKTQYCGRLVGLTNLCSAALQILGGVVLIHLFGLKGSHLMIPIILLMNAGILWVIPSFGAVSLAYVFLKSVDFSIFGTIREMLYTSLKLDEKYRAKAVIDVFAYRSSKALVSLIILGFQWMALPKTLICTQILSGIIYGVWIGVVLVIFWGKDRSLSKLTTPSSF